MRPSFRTACFAVAFVNVSFAALLAAPSGCGVQDVLIAQSVPGDDAGDASRPFKDYDARPTDVDAGKKSCGDGGDSSLCPDKDDANVRDPVEAGTVHPCSSNDDCSPAGQTFCAKSSCDPAARGDCQLILQTCSNVEEPVCGCDGVVYWNDCLRKRDGVASSTQGQCTSNYYTCGIDPEMPCPVPDARCFLETSQQCSVATNGVCWVPPDTCPDGGGALNWQTCGGQPGCIDFCTAITFRTQMPLKRADTPCQ